MTQLNEKVVKKGVFKRIAYSSYKRYTCEKGELILTTENLSINCEGRWTKTFSNREIRLETWGENLEVRDFWYSKPNNRVNWLINSTNVCIGKTSFPSVKYFIILCEIAFRSSFLPNLKQRLICSFVHKTRTENHFLSYAINSISLNLDIDAKAD